MKKNFKLQVASLIILFITLVLLAIELIIIPQDSKTFEREASLLGLISYVLIAGIIFLIVMIILNLRGRNNNLFLPTVIVTIIGVLLIKKVATGLFLMDIMWEIPFIWSYSLLDLCLTAFLVVSLVFASKGKKWATYSVIALLGVYLVYGYEIFEMFHYNLISESSILSQAEQDWFIHYSLACFANLLVFIAVIVIYSQNLVKEEEKVEVEAIKNE